MIKSVGPSIGACEADVTVRSVLQNDPRGIELIVEGIPFDNFCDGRCLKGEASRYGAAFADTIAGDESGNTI